MHQAYDDGVRARRGLLLRRTRIAIITRRPFEIVDLTTILAAVVGNCGLMDGVLTIQTHHTTTGLLVNEHEPMLLADLEAMFERLVPSDLPYAHDDFARRVPDLGVAERRNGAAHCRAALLRSSESIAVSHGQLTLGRWQRIFLVEFDGGQRRHVLLTLFGRGRTRRADRAGTGE